MVRSIRALVLAAGRGKRMKSAKSKVLHRILGKTLIEYIIAALEFDWIERIGVIVGEHNAGGIAGIIGGRADYIIQKEQSGSAHAVMAAGPWLKDFRGSLVVVAGDAPFITVGLMRRLIRQQQQSSLAAAFLSGIYESPPPYGRVVRDVKGRVQRIVEEKDASPAEKMIKEVSSSHYCFDVQKLFPALNKVDRNNAQHEYYLPDVIAILTAAGENVEALPVDDPFLTFGINTREDLRAGSRELKKRSEKF